MTSDCINDENGAAPAVRTGVTDEQIDQFHDTFVNRLDPFFVQNADGTYNRVNRSLNRGHIRAHLQGGITLALLPGEDSMTSFAVVDIDRASPDAVAPVWKQCDSLGLEVLKVYSGRKGFHVFVFFNEPTPLAQAQDVVRLTAGANEVWPRQREIRRGACGNAIKAPFGVHRATGNWCVAVNHGFEAIENPWAMLRTLTRVDAETLLTWTAGAGGDAVHPSAFRTRNLPNRVRPCLATEWRRGTELGKRNEVGFALASEFRRIGLPEVEALDRLEQWNRRCRPPLSEREVRSLCRSAYATSQPYVFSCGPRGALRHLVTCADASGCLGGSGTGQADGAGSLRKDGGNLAEPENKQLVL